MCKKAPISVLVLVAVLALGSAVAATETPKPVFLRSVCNGRFSSALLSTLKSEISTSHKYQLVSSLDDNGRMDVVLEIMMSCADRESVVAVATIYGTAKCSSPTSCHATVDGTSLSVALCDSNLAAECGRTLFRAFDAFVDSPSAAHIKLN